MPKRSRRQSEVLLLLSAKQKQLLAEILGNMAVAWFTVGVISPLFLINPNPDRIAISVSAGILLTVAFILASLSLIGRKK